MKKQEGFTIYYLLYRNTFCVEYRVNVQLYLRVEIND